MKVLLTGVSSFTGAHIARALKDAGHEVYGVLTGLRHEPHHELSHHELSHHKPSDHEPSRREPHHESSHHEPSHYELSRHEHRYEPSHHEPIRHEHREEPRHHEPIRHEHREEPRHHEPSRHEFRDEPGERGASATKLTLRERRLRFSGVTHWIENAPFGSPAFLSALQNIKPDVIVNHGADIKGYRSPDFDVQRSVSQSLFNVEKVFDFAQRVGVKRFIHSGTVFEPHAGLPAKSVYGESKARVAQSLEAEARRVGIPFSKIFIPNPVGGLENEDRLIPSFVRKWKNGEQPHLSAPAPISDHIPAEWLASFYVEEVGRSADPQSKEASSIFRRPSAFSWSNQKLVDRFIAEARALGVPGNFQYSTPSTSPASSASSPQEPARLGTEACPQLQDPQEVSRFWRDWILFHWPS